MGINFLTSREPIWFAGPDIIASILLTGKVPRIEKAIRVKPYGKQQGLTSTSLRGMVKVDANKNGFFRHVIEQRAAHESNPALHYWLKILANRGSYGLFVELNPNEADAARLKVFSGEESFETRYTWWRNRGSGCAPHGFSDHVRWSLALRNARKAYSGCRGHVPVLRYGQRGYRFDSAQAANPDAEWCKANHGTIRGSGATHR
jgi:hypothetical protein